MIEVHDLTKRYTAPRWQPGAAPSGGDNRRVQAVLRYLGT